MAGDVGPEGQAWDRIQLLRLLVGEMARFLGKELPKPDRDDGIRRQLSDPAARMVAFCGVGDDGDRVQQMAIEARWTVDEIRSGGAHCLRLAERVATENLVLLEQSAIQHPTIGTLAEVEVYNGDRGVAVGAIWLHHHPEPLKRYYKEWWDEADVRVVSVVLGRDVNEIRAEVARSLAPPRMENWKAG